MTTPAPRPVADIPVVRTPPGGYGAEMPPPVLADAADPLPAGAPDLRGTWVVDHVEVDGGPAPADHPVRQHRERIEQAGDRVVVTGGGVVHDMRADGVEDHGVHDVMAVDFVTPLVVTATYEEEALVLRPRDLPGVEVRRWRDGDRMVWRYHTVFTATLRRADP